mmetsp:Transcript_60572/g.180116  ORF Transcript_60572/g.180116 Transcript_60572/m.180116 type:complete len:258 (+) Transcript_60572:1943-2716(+)
MKWAIANQFPGKARPGDGSLCELLIFCEDQAPQTFDAVLLRHAAADFKAISAHEAFSKLPASILHRLLARDDLAVHTEADILVAVGPWFTGRTVREVVRALEHVVLREVPPRLLKDSLAAGGVLHEFRDEAALRKLVSQAVRAQFTGKRQRSDEPPDELVCPITFQLMVDPVVAADGHTYERSAVEDWLKTHNRSPKCNTPLDHKLVVPNHLIHLQIREYLDRSETASPRMRKRCKRLGIEPPASNPDDACMDLLGS